LSKRKGKIVTAAFGTAPKKARVARARRKHPIADKLVKKMDRYVRNKVVDLNAVVSR